MVVLTIIVILVTGINVFAFAYCCFRKSRDQINANIDFLGSQDVCKVGRLRKTIGRLSYWVDSFVFMYFKFVGYFPSHAIRNFLYRHVFLMKLGKHVVIYYGLEARRPWLISIGDGSIIGDKCIMDARNGIIIGENVNFSSGVWIWTEQHDCNSSTFGVSNKDNKTVVIGNRAWISSRTTVLPGCNVAEGCVLAAGAVLTKEISESYLIYGGVPAKQIGCRCKNLTYEFTGEHRYFI